jgi:hypothetical protein
VKRDVCLVSHNGQTFCRGQLSTIWNISTHNQGSAFILTNFASENCNEADGRFQSDVSNAINGMAAAFATILANDADPIIAQLKQKTDAVSVDAQ